MAMGGHLGFRGGDDPKCENIHSVAFDISKIVELAILCIFIA